MCVSTYASNIVCRLFLRHAMSLATYSSQPSSIILQLHDNQVKVQYNDGA